MDRALIKKSIDDWRQVHLRIKSSLIPRSDIKTPTAKHPRALIGVRRSGKTTKAIDIFTNQDPKETLYYNFEDPLFYPSGTAQDIDKLIEVAQEYNNNGIKNLILDEIQNVAGWERWLRKKIDQEKYKIVVTGSSAKLLSQDLATALAGRALETKVWPLSFKEYLSFVNLQPKEHIEYILALKNFMLWGGFPEIVLTENEVEKSEILRQYLSDIVLKDVISRNEIRNTRALDQLIVYYLTNLSSLHSYSALKNAFSIGSETAASYSEGLQNAFLIFEVERYHHNLKVQARDPRKVYIIDLGLRKVGSRSISDDEGKLLENIIFIELMRQEKKVMYFYEKQEVDFLILENYRPIEAIQVCFDLEDPKTFKREVDGLIECLNAVSLNEGTFITWDKEETIRINGKKIAIIPAYKWLI